MRITRCLALALFTAGLLFLLADLTPAAELTKQEQKQLLKAERKKKRLEALAAEAKPAIEPMPVVVAKPTLPLKPAAELARLIDGRIDRKLAEAKVVPSPLCSDEEFLRRAYLDLTGVIPTADQARAFIDSGESGKRTRLIDQLLASPNYGRHMADIWQAKLFPKDSNNRLVLKEPFVQWLADEFNRDTPWDQFVAQLLTASGTVEQNPAVTFLLANRSADKLADQVGNHFLHVQIQCAQCHNHPFVKEWKQTDYWGIASFFEKVRADKPKNANQGGDNTKIGVQEGGGRTKTKDFFPEATKEVPPKFFLGDRPTLAASQPYRPSLARWLTSPENPFFAKGIVNRTWAQLFGPGFVNPIEDMHDGNTPSHPELLAELAHEFGHSGYDLKHLIRSICYSRTYQRTSRPTAGNEKAEALLFAHQTMKVMTPEQMYDSLAVVGAGEADEGKKKPKGMKGPANNPRDRFVAFFLAGAEQPNPNEYEAGIPQALRLMNSRQAVGGMKALGGFLKGDRASAQVVEQIYLTALSRRPTLAETERLGHYLSANGASAQTYGDILWAVLNSSEFAMVR